MEGVEVLQRSLQFWEHPDEESAYSVVLSSSLVPSSPSSSKEVGVPVFVFGFHFLLFHASVMGLTGRVDDSICCLGGLEGD